MRIRLNYEEEKKLLTYPGISNRADAEEGRPVRSQATLPTLLKQLLLEGESARNGGRRGRRRRRGGRRRRERLYVEPPHGTDEGLLLAGRRLGALLCINPGGRQLHRKTN